MDSQILWLSLALLLIIEGIGPLFFPRRWQALLRQLLAQPDAGAGRQWQAAHPEQVHRWPTHNRHYVTDVDSPADIEAMAPAPGDRLMIQQATRNASQVSSATAIPQINQ